MRYVRHAPALQSALVRISTFAIGASALWPCCDRGAT